VGLIRALFWPDHGNLNDVADDLFQGLTVLLIHGQHEEGQHDQHHAHGRHTASRRLPEQKEKWYADMRSAAKADQLPLGHVQLNQDEAGRQWSRSAYRRSSILI